MAQNIIGISVPVVSPFFSSILPMNLWKCAFCDTDNISSDYCVNEQYCMFCGNLNYGTSRQIKLNGIIQSILGSDINYIYLPLKMSGDRQENIYAIDSSHLRSKFKMPELFFYEELMRHTYCVVRGKTETEIYDGIIKFEKFFYQNLEKMRSLLFSNFFESTKRRLNLYSLTNNLLNFQFNDSEFYGNLMTYTNQITVIINSLNRKSRSITEEKLYSNIVFSEQYFKDMSLSCSRFENIYFKDCIFDNSLFIKSFVCDCKFINCRFKHKHIFFDSIFVNNVFENVFYHDILISSQNNIHRILL